MVDWVKLGFKLCMYILWMEVDACGSAITFVWDQVTGPYVFINCKGDANVLSEWTGKRKLGGSNVFDTSPAKQLCTW